MQKMENIFRAKLLQLIILFASFFTSNVFAIDLPNKRCANVKLQKQDSQFLPDEFYGKWYIVFTTLSFWKGKQNATIVYTPLTDHKSISSFVEYKINNKSKTIIGINTPDEKKSNHFFWSGKSFPLSSLKSEWYVVSFKSKSPQYLITFFGPTLFTKDGMNIYARSPMLDKTIVQNIVDCIKETEGLKKYYGSFFPIIHDGYENQRYANVKGVFFPY